LSPGVAAEDREQERERTGEGRRRQADPVTGSLGPQRAFFAPDVPVTMAL
jgi:hypothetical protein